MILCFSATVIGLIKESSILMKSTLDPSNLLVILGHFQNVFNFCVS